MFDIKNVRHLMNTKRCKTGMYGYFGNNLDSLKNAVEKKKTNFNVIYARLDFILDEKYERRYGTQYGTFSLFYPLDTKINKERY